MKRFLLLAGLSVGGLVWAANTQVGQILPYPECRNGVPLLGLTSLTAVLIAVAAALLSSRRHRPASAAVDSFMARLGVMAGALFAFVILLQGLASLVLTGCER